MSDLPVKETIRIDPQTGVVIAMSGDYKNNGNTGTVLGSPKQAMFLVGQNGERVDACGDALRVVIASGMPVHVDITGSDTYDVWTTVMSCPREMHYIHATAIGQDALLSIDGGKTAYFYLTKAVTYTFEGLRIPAGAQIAAINQSAAANFTSLFLTVW